MFGRRIKREIGSWDEPLHRAQIDDSALPLTAHCRQDRVGHAENAEDVHVKQRLSLGHRGLLRATKQTHASIVDKQVDAPGLGQHVIDQFRHGRVIGHVAGQHGHAVGSFGGGATAGSEHAKARILQGFGRCMPDAGGCARHQGDARIGLVHGDHFFLCAGLRFEMSRGFVGHRTWWIWQEPGTAEGKASVTGPSGVRAGQLVGPAPE